MLNLNDPWGQMMDNTIESLVALLVSTGIIKVVSLIFHARPRLVYWQVDAPSIVLNRQSVYVKTLFMKNVGGQEAKDVRVIHNWAKNTFGVAVQPMSYTLGQTQTGNAIIKLDSVHKRETCVITYVHNTPPSADPLVGSIRTDDHTAHLIKTPTPPKYPMWVIWVCRILAFVGAWLILYLAIWLLIMAWRALFG